MSYLDDYIMKLKEKNAGKSEEKKLEKPDEKKPIEEKKEDKFLEKTEPLVEQEKPVKKPEIPEGNLIVIDSYDNVKIYKKEGEPLLFYEVVEVRPSPAEQTIISTIKEIATRLITIEPYRIRDPEQRRNVYFQKIMDILESTPELNIPKSRFEYYANAVVREMVGYGLLDPLIKDDNLEEIMVIGPNKPVYVFHREYEMLKTNIVFYSEKEIEDLINRIAREVGRRIDFANPLLDARLPDGSRVNATIPPASLDGGTITIRKFRKDPYSIIDLINYGTVNTEVAAFLWLAVEGLKSKPANIIIGGGTGSGKTTTLNVLCSFIPPHERIISIEDTAELNLPIEHWVRLESRPPGIEGGGEITLDILVKNALRMRPDRIIVGEVRHKEAEALFTAMNTGHDGSMGTLHTNSSQEAIVRITSPPMEVPVMMLSGLDLIIIQNRIYDRRKGTIRRIVEIAEVTGVLEGSPRTQKIYEWDAADDTIKPTGVPSLYLKKLQLFTGLSYAQIQEEIEKRKEFLDGLRKEGIRDMKKVANAMKRFLEENQR